MGANGVEGAECGSRAGPLLPHLPALTSVRRRGRSIASARGCPEDRTPPLGPWQCPGFCAAFRTQSSSETQYPETMFIFAELT